MKRLVVYLTILITPVTVTFAQDWITLKTPQSGILGAPVKKIKNGDINFNFNLKYDKAPQVETREGPESSMEYESMFTNFTTKYFNTTKVKVQTVKAYNLKIRTLSQESIDKLQKGGKYVYEGIAADSVTITIAAKKNYSVDFSKALKDIAAVITKPSVTEIIEKAAPMLDSIKYLKNDSVYYKVTVKNPNIYYKVKVIKLKNPSNICGCDWETNCFLYFTNRVEEDFPRKITLKVDFIGEESTTVSRYPEFCGKDRVGVQYYLKVEKDENGKLHLFVYGTSANLDNPVEKKLEVPFRDNGEIREWRLDRTYLYRFSKKGIIKNVYIEVAARQIDDEVIEILNWRKGTNSLGNNALTCLRYPEFKGKYVKK